tara:strand:+ start:3916 stop:4344 length:429 start_codon:yes stop_codon:yes gene_type:complete
MAIDIIKRRGNGGQSHKRYRLTNSTIVEIGDPVYLTSGRLDLATTSSAVAGISKEAKTGTGSNYLYIEEICGKTEYEMVTNATISAADEGVYFKLAASTNTFTVDKSSGAQTTTARQVVLTKFISATKCLVKFVKVQAFQDN